MKYKYKGTLNVVQFNGKFYADLKDVIKVIKDLCEFFPVKEIGALKLSSNKNKKGGKR